LIEQPIAGYDDAGARILREHSKAAIMADEALRGGPQTAMRIAKAGAADVFALKIAQAGGLMKCRAVAEIAKANGIGLYGGTMLEGPVATIASAHLFSALPEMEWGTELFGPLLLTEDILANPLDYSDFGLTVPDGPGLGITLNEDAVSEAIARDKAEWQKKKPKPKPCKRLAHGDTFGAWRDSIPMSASSMSKARLRFTN